MDEADEREPIWGIDAPAPVPCRNQTCRNQFIGFWGEYCSQDCADERATDYWCRICDAGAEGCTHPIDTTSIHKQEAERG